MQKIVILAGLLLLAGCADESNKQEAAKQNWDEINWDQGEWN